MKYCMKNVKEVVIAMLLPRKRRTVCMFRRWSSEDIHALFNQTFLSQTTIFSFMLQTSLSSKGADPKPLHFFSVYYSELYQKFVVEKMWLVVCVVRITRTVRTAEEGL